MRAKMQALHPVWRARHLPRCELTTSVGL